MFETKYSRMLTIFMIAGIVLIVLILGITGLIIAKNGNEKREALDAVDRFKGQINEQTEDTTKNNASEPVNEIAPSIGIENIVTNNKSSTNKEDDTKTYKGFPMVGTIEIPAINLNYPVLKDASKASMEISVGIYDGPGLNEIGNTTIAGHNYRDGRFFANNKKLVEGDKVYITDLTGRKITYSIYKTYTTSPEDSSYLDRETEGRREISLTTCTDDTQSRLIIWAKEQ